MTTKDYLEQLKDVSIKGNYYLQEAQKWHELASSVSISYDKEPVKSSGNKQKMESASVNAVYYEQKARERMESYFTLRDNIITQIIEMGGDSSYREILYKHYVEDKHLSDVAKEVGYSPSHTRRLYNSALNFFEKTYGKHYLKKYGKK